MFWKKSSRKKLIISAIIIGLIIFGIFRAFRKEEPFFDLIEVTRGNVIKELWETGRVQRGERIGLSFKTTGEIEEIYVKTNQIVEKGELLAKLNTRNLNIQSEEARLAFESARLNLEKLLAGVSSEEIQIAQTRVDGTKILLENSQKSLQNSHETAVTTLNSSYPGLDEAADLIRELIQNYVVIYDQDTRKIIQARDLITEARDQAKSYLEIARASGADSKDTEKALSVMRSSLEETFENLKNVREVIEESILYKDKVSAADKVLLDALKAVINSSLANIISSQQSIVSAKSGLETARINFQEAQDYLALAKAEPSSVSIALYENQIKQAQSRVLLYENQLEEAILRSPIKAQVASLNKKAGERASALEPVIFLSPDLPFEIAVDIYEEDIIEIAIGDPVEINLLALPQKTLLGSVIFIDETEKIIDGVVNYEVKIAFNEDPPAGIKTAMTADIVIGVGKKENVLAIPSSAVPRTGEKAIVQVLAEGSIEEREVEIGLRGEVFVEVISGLKEGEMIVVR